MIPPLNITIDENTKPQDLERIRRNLAEQIRELQQQPTTFERVLADKTLADGVATQIAHGLGRPAYVFVSPPRGGVTAGRIEEIRDTGVDRKRYIVLKATGWNATITVDVRVL